MELTLLFNRSIKFKSNLIPKFVVIVGQHFKILLSTYIKWIWFEKIFGLLFPILFTFTYMVWFYWWAIPITFLNGDWESRFLKVISEWLEIGP